MRLILVVIAVVCSVLPTAAQSPLYTNADIGKAHVTWTRTVTPEELRGLQARQFVYVPDGRQAEPFIAVMGGDASEGPFGAFAPKIPDRRLDGSQWTDPPWEQRAYVAYGHRGGVRRDGRWTERHGPQTTGR